MSDLDRAVHPLYPDVPATEWADAKAKVALLVQDKVGTALGDPWDIAEDAVRRAYEPTAPVWDRSKKSLARYLGSFANSMMANGLRKLEFKSTRPIDHADLADAAAAGEDPEEATARAEADAIAASRLAQVRAIVRDDACCITLLDAMARGVLKTHKEAIALGFTYRQVELAREKMERAALKVLDTEARAARKKS